MEKQQFEFMRKQQEENDRLLKQYLDAKRRLNSTMPNGPGL